MPAVFRRPATSGRKPILRRPPLVAWPRSFSLSLPQLEGRGYWVVAAAAIVLFACGWLLGTVPTPGSAQKEGSSGFTRFMRAMIPIGVRYECVVVSEPEGAAILVDGVNTRRVTPATLELRPGEHRLTLRVGTWGASTRLVKGDRGERVEVNANLSGSIMITLPANTSPVSVSVDNIPSGDAPVRVDHLAPGPHEVRFYKHGTPPWVKMVDVRVNDVTKLAALSYSGSQKGQLEIRATRMDVGGHEEVDRAQVRIDGEGRGRTPLTVSLPSGPHSVMVSYQDEQAPVQVIDLPGGNKRYANFVFGSGLDQPRLSILKHGISRSRRLATFSAELEGVSRGELGEMWLHVRDGEGIWRRYPMSPLAAAGGVVGTSVLPAGLFRQGARYYASAATTTGDEYFTEIKTTPAQ